MAQNAHLQPKTIVFDSQDFDVNEAVYVSELVYGAPQGSTEARRYKKGSWAPQETMVLQACKRVDLERHGPGAGAKAMFEPASERWATIEADVCKRGVTRSAQQCKDKWEQVQADFKKVYDFEKKIPSGTPGYYQMDSTQTKETLGLPRVFFPEEVFIAMCDWFVKRSVVVEPGNMPIDMSSPMARGTGDSEESQVGDPTTDSGSPSTAKRRRFNKKTSDGLAGVMENRSKATVASMAAAQDAENKRNADREGGQDRRHAETLALERERMESAERLGMGFIGALAGIGDGLKSLALALNAPRQ